MHGGKSDRNMKYDKFFSTSLGRRILEEEAKYVAENFDGKAVSIGCGTGIIERKAMEISNGEIIGVEIDDNMIEMARKRIDIIKANAENLPFKNLSFDATIFITSMEFIDEYKKAINEAYRILKENGKIIAILLNTSSTYFKKRYKEGGYIRKNIKHLNVEKIEKHMAKKFFIKREGLFRVENEDLIKPGNSVYGITGAKKSGQ